MSNNFIVNVFSIYYSSVSGSRIGTEEALYLYTSGPDLTSIMPCKYGKPTGIFTKFVTEDSLRSEHVRELFIKNKDVDTAALVVSQAFNNFLGFFTSNKLSNIEQCIQYTLLQIPVIIVQCTFPLSFLSECVLVKGCICVVLFYVSFIVSFHTV